MKLDGIATWTVTLDGKEASERTVVIADSKQLEKMVLTVPFKVGRRWHEIHVGLVFTPPVVPSEPSGHTSA